MNKPQTQLATKFEFVRNKNGAYVNQGYRVVRLVPYLKTNTKQKKNKTQILSKKIMKALVFPGQGSPILRNGKKLYDSRKEIKDLMDFSNQILGF